MKLFRWFLFTSCFLLHTCAVANAAPSVESWLKYHTQVRQAIVWIKPVANEVKEFPYEKWDAAQRAELQSAFEKAWNDQPFPLADPPQNLAAKPKDGKGLTVLSPADAWDFYLANIATSLSNEIGKRLPWSIEKYSADNLQVLFHAGRVYTWNGEYGGYKIYGMQVGSYTPSPPQKILKFLEEIGAATLKQPQAPQGLPKDILTTGNFKLPEINSRILRIPQGNRRIVIPTGKTLSPRMTAIVRVMDWCRYKLLHFSGSYDVPNLELHWQYSGLPPLSRIIDGTEKKPGDLRHYSAGCHGTVGFLSGTLRLINIPVKYLNFCGHALPHFSSEDVYLSHGDDVYGTFASQRILAIYKDADYQTLRQKQPLDYPSEELLISASEFNTLLAKAETDISLCDNIGRHYTEVGVEFLPTYLLLNYCSDKANNLSHENGTVYASIKKYYSLQQLDALNFWSRMEKKIQEKGGCGKF